MSDQPPPPPPPPPPSAQPPGAQPPALESVGPWLRLGARIIDGLVLFIPNLLVAIVIAGGAGSSFGTGSGGSELLAGVITTLISFGYAVWLESTRGQTVGKMALSIKVIGADGGLPTPEIAGRRNAWILLSIIPIVGGLITFVLAIVIGVTINNDPFNRGVHDNFAGGTAVVRR